MVGIGNVHGVQKWEGNILNYFTFGVNSPNTRLVSADAILYWSSAHLQCNQGYFELSEALANRNKFDGGILHSFSSCSV